MYHVPQRASVQHDAFPALLLCYRSCPFSTLFAGFSSFVFRGDFARTVLHLFLHGTSQASWVLLPAPLKEQAAVFNASAPTWTGVAVVIVPTTVRSKYYKLPRLISLDLLFLSYLWSLPLLSLCVGSWTFRTPNTTALEERGWPRSCGHSTVVSICDASEAPELALLLRGLCVGSLAHHKQLWWRCFKNI